MAARVHTWSGKEGRAPAPLIDGPPASMGCRGAAAGREGGGVPPANGGSRGPAGGRPPANGRASGGRRGYMLRCRQRGSAASGARAGRGERRGRAGGSGRSGNGAAVVAALSPAGAHRGRGAPAAAGPEPCGVTEEALPASRTRTRPDPTQPAVPARWRVDAGAVIAPRGRAAPPLPPAMLRAAERR